VRGIRFNFNIAGPTSPDMIEPLSRRINDLGWHIQISTNAKQIVALEGLLMRVPSPVVFDHFGHPLPPASVNDAVFGTIRRLIDTGRIWVKMSLHAERHRPTELCGCHRAGASLCECCAGADAVGERLATSDPGPELPKRCDPVRSPGRLGAG
jgi:hypothetical protein